MKKDFLERLEEIDTKLKDRMKELMLYEQYGIKTIRISNKKVEKMLEERVVNLFAN